MPKGEKVRGPAAAPLAGTGRGRDHARRNEILDAAERVFASKPFPKVSMRDIAKEAGISPALIYRHFEDQQHLFIEAFLRGAERLLALMDERFAGLQDAGLEDASEIFITFLTTHEHYFKMMTHFMLEGTVHEDLLEDLNAIERSVLDRFDSLFRASGASCDVRMLSHCLFACLNGILITFRRHPGRSQEEVIGHMHRLGRIMAGLFTRHAGALKEEGRP